MVKVVDTVTVNRVPINITLFLIMNIVTAICCRCLLIVVVLVVASAVATLRGPLSFTRLAIIFLFVVYDIYLK